MKPIEQPDQWAQKECWKRHGKKFTVEVVHWTSPVAEWDYHKGPNHWNVYAYIFPGHPTFGSFNDTDDLFQDAANGLNLHCGASRVKAHCDRTGKVTCIEAGSDYGHLHDNEYSRMATREEAWSVFNDAEELFALLKAREEAFEAAKEPA